MSIGEWESRKNESTSSNLQTLQLNHLSEDMVYAVLQLAPRLLVLLLQDVRVRDNQSVAVSETSLTLSRLRRLIIKANPYVNNARNVMLPLFDIVVRGCAMSLRSLSLPVHCTGVIAQLAMHTDDLQIEHLELTVPTNSDWFHPSFGMMVPAKENKENIVNARRILSACPRLRLRHLQLTDFNFDDYPEILDGVSAPLSSFCSRACDRDGEAWQLAKYINEPLPALRQLRHMLSTSDAEDTTLTNYTEVCKARE
ncbi:hypothetical protein BKA62DRAFT_513708 [Auriculariales sp. MPI-PUGE-AT-0066]|nr:hypothetical protein BKA62DRAFT_513708 [Auriculariales sp. MPI-PUGE-AT-0066]